MRVGLGVASVVALGGCGRSQEYVSPEEQHALPTTQLSARGELCPDRTLPEPERRATKRRAHGHIAALIEAFSRHPDALVRTTYASSDEGPGREDLTVRQLLQQWIRLSYCAPAAQSQLKAALGASSP
jgi:Flp pilus assembly protein TadD